jgi:hypothetical protein
LGLAGAVSQEMSGVQQMRLQDLGELPEGVLAEMVPVWRAGLVVEVREEGLFCPGAEGEVRCVYGFAPYEKLMVDQYAGGRNLQTIAEHVARQSGMTAEEAFAATKALFLKLCRQGYCHPAASHAQSLRKEQSDEQHPES